MIQQPLSGRLRGIASELGPGDHRGELLRLAMVAAEYECLESACRVHVGRPVKRSHNPTATTRMKDCLRAHLSVLSKEKRIQGVRDDDTLTAHDPARWPADKRRFKDGANP